MMRWWLPITGLIVALLLVACGGGDDDDDIKQTVEDFVEALSEDRPRAYTLLAEDCKDQIEFIQFAAQLSLLDRFLGEGDLEVQDFEIDEENDEEVVADFDLVIVSDGEEIPLTVGIEEEGPTRFVKEEGRWRLADCGGFGPLEETALAEETPQVVPLDEAQVVEADDNPALPGDYVDLPALYGGPYSDTADHVSEQVDYRSQGLPPVGGPHWGQGLCPSDPAEAQPFCGPVPPGFYASTKDTWGAESLVHNLEHAGVVVWYNTADQNVIDELRDFANDNGPGRSGANVTAFFPEMEEDTVAITVWARRLVMPVDEFDRERLEEFYDAHECRFDPEAFCE